MKAIILAGGYAKRLWPITRHQPKQLLPVGGKTMLEYPLEKLELLKVIDENIISINAYFEFNFTEWFSKYQVRKNTRIIIEKTYSQKEKLGSVGALDFLIKRLKINSSILVIAGDNLFDFSIRPICDYYMKKRKPITVLDDIGDKNKIKGRYGVVQIDSNNKIIGFEEKPKNPKSTLINTGVFILPKKYLHCISDYIAEGNNPDTLGHFLKWLSKKTSVYGYVVDSPWFDIGSFETYNQANKYYKEVRFNQMRYRKRVESL